MARTLFTGPHGTADLALAEVGKVLASAIDTDVPIATFCTVVYQSNKIQCFSGDSGRSSADTLYFTTVAYRHIRGKFSFSKISLELPQGSREDFE